MATKLRRHRRRRASLMPRAELHSRNMDEVLEEIWTMKEGGSSDIAQLRAHLSEPWLETTLDEMLALHYISVQDGKITLEPAGHEKARQIIRRHRLAERLLTEVLEVNEETMEASACKFEHALNPEVTDSICTLLGHPPTCPHGKPIPRGECCQKYLQDIKPLLIRLSDLSPGQEATIAFISPRYHTRLDRLGSFGIIPGTKIRLHQLEPAPVVQVGETDLAIEKEIAREIYVRIV